MHLPKTPQHNPFVIMLIGLSITLMTLLLSAGCGRQATPKVTPKEAVTAEEVVVPEAIPFQDAARKTADIIADAAREQPSITSTENLNELHLSGMAILLIAIAARFIFGSWKDAYIAAGLGAIPSIFAILLTEYARVVLLIPVCGVALLATVLIRRIIEWRTKAQGFDASATIIEKSDTGPNSLGQLMKDHIAETGLSDIIDKALKPLEKIWNAKEN